MNEKQQPSGSAVVPTVVVGLYGLSLLLPAFDLAAGSDGYYVGFAVVLAASCLTYPGQTIAQDSSGKETMIVGMGTGYFVWTASMVLGLAWAVYRAVFGVRGRPGRSR